MRVNLARVKLLTRDSTGKILTENQLASLTDGNTTTSGVGVGSGEVLSVVLDLGARYDLDEVRYYRTRASVDSIVLAARQTATDSWTTLAATESTYTSAVVPSSVDKYQFIRLTHSTTTGSGTARELEVYTDDTQILFGSDEQGRLNEYHVDTGTNLLAPAAVHIYNPDSVEHDFYVLLDPSDSDSAYYSLASGTGGPFYPLYSTGVNLPGTYPWSAGVTASGTRIVSNTVMKAVNTATSGTYFTPIFDLGQVQGRRFFWTATLSGLNELDVDRQRDNLPTVDVRMSNVAPTGSWVSGQVSNDGRWSVVSGSLPFVPMPNDTILDPSYRRYFQARVEFHTTTSGQTPILTSLGIESAFKVPVPAHQSAPIYVRSNTTTNRKGSPTTLTCWYFEDRDVE